MQWGFLGLNKRVRLIRPARRAEAPKEKRVPDQFIALATLSIA
jgi:hypothetical protein